MSSADELFERAFASDQAGRFEDAEELYREAAASGHATAAYNLAELLTRQEGRAVEAEAACHAAIAAGDADGWWLLAWLLEDQDGRTDDAEAAWRAAVEAGSRGARSGLGRFLVAQRRLDEAGEELERAIEEEDDADALYELASLREDQEREGDAERLYRRAINAGNTDAVGALGQLLSAQGRLQEAEGRLRAAAADDPMYLLALYGVLLETGRGDEIEALAGDSEEGRMLVATHLTMQAGREAQAEAAWRAVIATGRSGRRQLGDLLAGQPGREADAEASYRDAIAAGEPNTWRALGHLLARLPGREADAEQALRAAIAEREQTLAELGEADQEDAAAETFRDMWTAALARAWRDLGELLARLPGREAEAQAALKAAGG